MPVIANELMKRNKRQLLRYQSARYYVPLRIMIAIGCAVSLAAFLSQIIGAGHGAIRVYKLLLFGPVAQWPIWISWGWLACTLLAFGSIAALLVHRPIGTWVGFVGAGTAIMWLVADILKAPFSDLEAYDVLPSLVIISTTVLFPAGLQIWSGREILKGRGNSKAETGDVAAETGDVAGNDLRNR